MSNYKFDVSTAGLTAYVDENDLELLFQLQAESGLAADVRIVPGIKDSKRVHYLSTNATFQTDACSYNASGSTPLTEKTLTVAAIAVMEDFCTKSLNGFWAEQLVRQGSTSEEEVPQEIAAAWMTKKLNLVKRQLSIADFQGDVLSGNANLNKYDGLLKTVFADGSTIDGNTNNATTMTISNVLANFQNMYLAIPEDLRAGNPDGDQLIWWMPQAYYDLYIIAARNANLFHWDVKENTQKYHGTEVIMRPTVGLSGADKMIISTRDNIMIGMDGEDSQDADQMKIWYSEDDRTNHSLITFKRGVQYNFSDYIVRWGLGAS